MGEGLRNLFNQIDIQQCCSIQLHFDVENVFRMIRGKYLNRSFISIGERV